MEFVLAGLVVLALMLVIGYGVRRRREAWLRDCWGQCHYCGRNDYIGGWRALNLTGSSTTPFYSAVGCCPRCKHGCESRSDGRVTFFATRAEAADLAGQWNDDARHCGKRLTA